LYKFNTFNKKLKKLIVNVTRDFWVFHQAMWAMMWAVGCGWHQEFCAKMHFPLCQLCIQRQTTHAISLLHGT
jgi:hypothetical protein